MPTLGVLRCGLLGPSKHSSHRCFSAGEGLDCAIVSSILLGTEFQDGCSCVHVMSNWRFFALSETRDDTERLKRETQLDP